VFELTEEQISKIIEWEKRQGSGKLPYVLTLINKNTFQTYTCEDICFYIIPQSLRSKIFKKFNGTETKVLLILLETINGTIISTDWLVKQTGLSKTNLCRTKNNLIRNKILTFDLHNGTLEINYKNITEV
jgi:hypothetical protein